MTPKTWKATPPPPPPDETDEEEEESDETEYAYEDTFCNEGDALFHVPMKFGTTLDNGDNVMIRFDVEIAANDAEEAKDRASDITWDELVNTIPFDAESVESVKSFLEGIAGVVSSSITVDKESVPDDDFNILQINGDLHVVEVED